MPQEKGGKERFGTRFCRSQFLRLVVDGTGVEFETKTSETSKPMMLSPACVTDLDSSFPSTKPLHQNLHENLSILQQSDRKPRVPTRALSSTPQLPSQPTFSIVRRVRFKVDENDHILEDSLPRPDYPLEPNTWWSAREMEAIQRQAACVADFCLDCRPEYSDTATELLGLCARWQDQDRSTFSTDSAVSSFVSGTARGLEQTLVPMLQKRRMQALRATLEIQDRVESLSVDQRWHLIAKHYQHFSKYAAVWSRLLAEGDARVSDEKDV